MLAGPLIISIEICQSFGVRPPEILNTSILTRSGDPTIAGIRGSQLFLNYKNRSLILRIQHSVEKNLSKLKACGAQALRAHDLTE